MKTLYTVIIISILILISCSSVMEKKVDSFENSSYSIKVHKFMHLDTYAFSITEKAFWYNRSKEHAIIELEDLFNDGLINVIKTKKKVTAKEGLSENFTFAFIANEKRDTVYASFNKNLWTIKKNGEFEYYKDEEGELKKPFFEYSSFFSSCW